MPTSEVIIVLSIYINTHTEVHTWVKNLDCKMGPNDLAKGKISPNALQTKKKSQCFAKEKKSPNALQTKKKSQCFAKEKKVPMLLQTKKRSQCSCKRKKAMRYRPFWPCSVIQSWVS